MNKKKDKIVAVIEARMTSSRLPGKVLLEAAGKPMLEHLVDRLRRAPSIQEIVVATTVNRTDDCLEDFTKRVGVKCFRGSEADVMSRVIGAGENAAADIIVEVTGDCPIADPMIVEQTIRLFLYNPCDYAANRHLPAYPDGMGCQVFWLETLKRSARMTSDIHDHEHVTLFIRNHPEIFRHVYLPAPPDLYWPELRLTLDEVFDYELLKRLIEHFHADNPYFGCREVLAFLRQRPELLDINRAVKTTVIPNVIQAKERDKTKAL